MRLEKSFRYIISLDFKFRKLFSIWLADEKDGVLVDENLKIFAYQSKDLLMFDHGNKEFELCSDVTEFNVYYIQQWILNNQSMINFEEFLNFWNLCTDISNSIRLDFLGDSKDSLITTVYQKLFNGSGIFASENPNQLLDDIDLISLSRVMQNGLDLLQNNLNVIVEH